MADTKIGSVVGLLCAPDRQRAASVPTQQINSALDALGEEEAGKLDAMLRSVREKLRGLQGNRYPNSQDTALLIRLSKVERGLQHYLDLQRPGPAG